MFIADLLSRPPTEQEVARIARVEMHIRSMISVEGDSLVEEIKRHAKVDEDYQVILKALKEGSPKTVKGELKVKGNMDILSEKDGLIVMNSRLYIPTAMREDMLLRLHFQSPGYGQNLSQQSRLGVVAVY